MDLHLQGKVIIVTGGFKGIGHSISLQLAREDATVVILNRADGKQDEVRKELEEIGSPFDFHLLDLNDTDKIKPIVEEVHQKYGHIDGIVNNAGVNDNKDLETTSWQDFEKSIHGNLTHYYELVHAAVQYLKDSKGAVVNITSKTAFTGQGKTSAYAAAKGAIAGLTREWAAALVHDSVRVNAIVVSEAWTPLYADWIKTFGDEKAQQARLQVITDKIPLEHRMTKPEEIADTAAFLLSDRASHTTGQWVFVDGGYVHLDRALS
ncbi:MAG: SDR family oxidoreductase [Bifidobacteriaceae bacterium]|jgi:3-oxoacyl-[acyl-carrier protein] reductase/L-fucose dehydrogenase|nr:SDR family oxidoreductase [Bifidobacteriaceae bacterium]MCI1978487.1 SDR family oxidoreductase [Bifidobacteriaceae bacterium]